MNKFKKSLLLITALCIVLAVTSCSDKEQNTDIDDKNVLATVNGKALSKEEYDKSLAYYKDYVEYQYGENTWETEATKGLTYKEYYENYVMDTMTYRLLLLDAAEKEGLTASEEEKQHELENFKVYFQNDEDYKKYLEQSNMTEEDLLAELSNDILINQYVLSKIENLNPSDDELKTIFDDLRMNVQIKASHILVDTEEESLKVIERINKGEDFAELAKELSTDLGSGANGGDLDYFNYGKMVQPFSEAAFALEIGEVSEPVQSDFGYHIIKLTDRIVDNDMTVETEKDQLTEYYKTYKYEDLLEKLKSEAEIVKN
ncbi:MAG TPA: peptidylprolyl isomerase [Sedimentibacter sp.]|nr:peptidylprolyl isomerase [Sedimentibacter sp.]